MLDEKSSGCSGRDDGAAIAGAAQECSIWLCSLAAYAACVIECKSAAAMDIVTTQRRLCCQWWYHACAACMHQLSTADEVHRPDSVGTTGPEFHHQKLHDLSGRNAIQHECRCGFKRPALPCPDIQARRLALLHHVFSSNMAMLMANECCHKCNVCADQPYLNTVQGHCVRTGMAAFTWPVCMPSISCSDSSVKLGCASTPAERNMVLDDQCIFTMSLQLVSNHEDGHHHQGPHCSAFAIAALIAAALAHSTTPH
jgi:hypothetical protein